MHYKNVDDLKQKIITKYIKELMAELKSNDLLLKSKTWAMDDDDYHRNCRLEKKKENNLINEQIKRLNYARDRT